MKNKIGFIGLGKLGSIVAEILAEKYEVYGYDIDKKELSGVHICNSIKEIANQAELIFIAVQTPHSQGYGGEVPNAHLPKKNFDYSILISVIEELNEYLQDAHTIVIISTVLPGTIRNQIAPLIKKGTLLYNPYLIAMGTVADDFRNPEMIIIGAENGHPDNAKISHLKKVYSTFVKENTRYVIGTWEEAESTKIFYNTFISMKIAIVNMIQDVAENIGHMNVDIVTDALAKSTKRITSSAYMKAGMGDAGPCHPRDNIALSWLAQELDLGYDVFDAISKSREQQAKNLATKLMKYNNPVIIIGSHYKPNTDLTDGSYALLVGSYIKECNFPVYFNNHPDNTNSYTYLLCHEKMYDDFNFNKNSIIVDPWRTFKTNRSDLTIDYYGLKNM